MFKKAINKFANVLLTFIAIIIIVGIVICSMKNYNTPVVKTTVLYQDGTGSIVKNYNINGYVIPSIEQEVEVIASNDIIIKDINIEKDQYAFKNDKLFSIDFKNLEKQNFEKNEVYYDQIDEINEAIEKKTRNLSKFLGLEKININFINSKDNILIKAPCDGRLNNLKIEQGKAIKSQIVGDISDPDNIVISFYMTPNEYPLVSLGQHMLVAFSDYDGYYEGVVTNIDNNRISKNDNLGFVYKGELTMKNPGLITPGVTTATYFEQNGEARQSLANGGVVEDPHDTDIISPLYSNGSMDIYVQNLYVKDGDIVKKDQIIAEIGGKDLEDYISDAIRDIRKDMSKKDDIVKDINDMYSGFIEGNDGNITISDNGECTTNSRILVTYFPGSGTVNKGSTLMKYYVVSEDCEYIKLDVDNEHYYNGVRERLLDFKWNMDAYRSLKLDYISAKSFKDHYEVYFSLPRTTQYLNPYDELKLEMQYTVYSNFVVPKSAIVAEKGIKVGNPFYIYTLMDKDTYLGRETVVAGKATGYILDYDDNYVAVTFDDPSQIADIKKIINYVDSSYEKGMSVKLE